MERVLAAFVRALRAAGSPVSTSETIDAVKAVSFVGYSDRQVLKDTLGAVLAKSETEKHTHDALFELYFNREAPPPEALEEDQQSGDSDLDAEFDDLDVEALMQLAANGGQNAAAAIEQAAAAAGAENIRFATQIPHFVRRTLQLLGIDHLDQRILERMEQGGAEAEKATRAMMAARQTLQNLARQQVARYFDVYGKSATENFMNDLVANRQIEKLSEHDQARMKTLVAKLAKRLADKHARRRKLKNRGVLDVRKTIRRATAHDGVPFDLAFKFKKKDRPKIVVLCDVSGSVARYVGFLLMLLYALHEKVADLSAFAFSAHLADVDPIMRNNEFEAAMTLILRTVAGTTDYGKALADLMESEHASLIDRRTTILVLGDARSNYGDPRLDLFRELADRSKRIVWLNPELPALWGFGDSCIHQYRPFCTTLTHCATVADIERAMDDILKAYD
ncbi:MAG: VWA domain-containing protein [Alphaproteobacteria bacterium]|nr:VWA domain-containing protein [Alphaproteobacteria bacterium]MBV9539832.1 VWA domain-containing protein [Alphaproteobacteria bacterium]MBV9904753.1 VWA domain-containing protein [Alphaproteobacteria bacterium]